MIYDVVIAGAGVVGGMIARELSKYKLSVCILEKENDVAMGASKANSGIVHGGFDPEPGTLKAKLNVAGVDMLYEAADQLNVPYKKNGSLVCAFGAEEEPAVHELYERGLINGVKEMKILSGDEARKIEPRLSEACTLALYIPTAGIVCPYQLTLSAIGNAMDNGVELIRNFEITDIEHTDVFTVKSYNGHSVQGKYFINCAGCYSDEIATKAGDCSFNIIPRAGEYLLLDKTEGETVTHTIFQVPSKEGKGILVSPTADGNLLTGPTASVVETAENTEITQAGVDTVIKFAAKSVPSVQFRQVITSFAGVRSSEKNGDFIIEASKKVSGLVNVAAIDSPGLTSCVAIARYVVGILKDIGVTLSEKENWDGNRVNTHAFREMNDEEKDAFIKENPSYGKIVCRCETISEGEILDAIRRNPKALDIDSVKRRTRAGMGRCQGGFCSPYVMKLIAKEQGIPMEQVTKKGEGSYIAIGKI